MSNPIALIPFHTQSGWGMVVQSHRSLIFFYRYYALVCACVRCFLMLAHIPLFLRSSFRLSSFSPSDKRQVLSAF